MRPLIFKSCVVKGLSLVSPADDDSRQSPLRIYLRIAGLLRPHWKPAIASVVCLGLSTVFALIVPSLLKWVVDVGVRQGDFRSLLLAAIGILVVSSLRGVFAYGQGYLSQAASQEVAYDLRKTVYLHLQSLDFSYHDDSETGQTMSRMTVDIEAVRNFITMGLLRALQAVAMYGGISVLLLLLNWQLGLVTLISVPLLILLAVQVSRKLRPMWLRVQNETGALGTIMQESLSGVRVVKAFAREDYEVERFDRKNQEVRSLNLSALRTSAWNQPLMVLVLNIITVAVIWVGGASVIGQRLTIGELFQVTQYVLLLAMPTATFGYMVNWFARGLSGGTRVFDVLDTQPRIVDSPNAIALDPRKVEGHVRFEHVDFSYLTGRQVLEDINIDAQPGQTIAILGATGSGKSTILHLLPRLYDVSGGRITLDGYDIRDVTLESLRNTVGMTLQDVFLFNATLRDNIAFGVDDATDEEIMAAAKAARVDDFVHVLPDGYDTWIGERGVTLSGGQKQRVSIARTLLRNPRVLILDEATSSVDMETEYLIQQALDELMKGRTTFVVASRLRTIKSADQILVMENGRIAERGTHESLLLQNGIYRRVYDLQLRDQEEFENRSLRVKSRHEKEDVVL